jgi:hypothetical protein
MTVGKSVGLLFFLVFRLKRFTDMVGVLWSALADYYIRQVG